VREGLQIQARRRAMPEMGTPSNNLYVVVHVTTQFFGAVTTTCLDIINVAKGRAGRQGLIPTVDGDADDISAQTGKVFSCAASIPACAPTAHIRAGATNWCTSGQIPTKLTDEQRELFEQLRRPPGSQILPRLNGRFDG
jgi:hypothetical protein